MSCWCDKCPSLAEIALALSLSLSLSSPLYYQLFFLSPSPICLLPLYPSILLSSFPSQEQCLSYQSWSVNSLTIFKWQGANINPFCSHPAVWWLRPSGLWPLNFFFHKCGNIFSPNHLF
ncbi:hypothetical protein PTSG_12716 [Salpingoeca rosetta]|uniref:Uncharacterized protein n=1 Tax=Salpingoeca rosetta (strain ATCC 50818 / BSB-021) TaxID=946362 RepID=F2UJI6_SALR5|nr:uncharacterized protein PTSG_12716 [Salpingoeca rosetta]EGD77285.1 hypothetical protein PTSG_12716 [Salpingoeca rosetta]|eukprot:XP_004990629.1 hypothetical protein PTSG_12716 [Salpingoeca rosetta]